MQPLQNCIGPTIRIGREIRCLPYAGFFSSSFLSLFCYMNFNFLNLDNVMFHLKVMSKRDLNIYNSKEYNKFVLKVHL